MNCAISQQQQDVVAGLTGLLAAVILESFKDWAEVSWATELNGGQSLSVQTHDALNSVDFRVAHISIDREAVAHMWIRGHDATKSEHWELLVKIIRLNDTADLSDGSLVLVVGPHEVQTVGVLLVTIRTRVVDSDTLGDLPATPEPVLEGMLTVML